MNSRTMILLGGGLALVCWVLAKVAHYAARVLEALAAIVGLFVTLWLSTKGA